MAIPGEYRTADSPLAAPSEWRVQSPEPSVEDRESPAKIRRSDRVAVELPLQISGADIHNFVFVESARTAVISRHGARICSRRKMARDQELVILCLSTGKECEARIVGELGRDAEGFTYGIAFLDTQINIWDVEFPPWSPSGLRSHCSLLECRGCHHREAVRLDAVEVDVLDAGQGLSRLCKRCTDTTIWGLVGREESPLTSIKSRPKSMQTTIEKMPHESIGKSLN